MQTPEPLTTARLYELCELAKTSPRGSMVKVSREELWALVDMAKDLDFSLEEARSLIASFDAAISRIAAELTTQACCGVDTSEEINPETGQPYGPGGHTGWLLAHEAAKLRLRAGTAVTYNATEHHIEIKEQP